MFSGTLQLELRKVEPYTNLVAIRREGEKSDLISLLTAHHRENKVESLDPERQHGLYTIDGIGALSVSTERIESYIALEGGVGAEKLFEQLASRSRERKE